MSLRKLKRAKEKGLPKTPVKSAEFERLRKEAALHYAAGRLDAAAASFREAINLSPRDAELHNNLGSILHAQGRLEQAIPCYQAALNLDPLHSGALFNLGNIHFSRSNLPAAADFFRKCLRVSPDSSDALNNLGIVLWQSFLRNRDRTMLDEARQIFGALVARRPDSAAAYYHLGLVLEEMNRLENARQAYQRALAIEPRFAGAYIGLGSATRHLGDMTGAMASYQRAVAIDPALSEAHAGLASACHHLGRHAEALDHYAEALRLRPGSAEALAGLAVVHDALGHREQALECSRQAHEAMPENLKLHVTYLSSLYKYKLDHCDWQDLDRLGPELDTMIDTCLRHGITVTESPLETIIRSDDPSRCLAVARSWSEEIYARLTSAGPLFPHGARRGAEKARLTLGYLSNDFCDHVVARQIVQLFSLHDRNRFAVNCYSYGPDDGSPVRRRIMADTDRFIDLGGRSDAEAAHQIHADGVDILIDLKGWTAGSRMGICALRPAPVQVGWLGFPGTIGGRFIDYIIADHTVIPAAHQDFYSETVINLPQTFFMTDNRQPLPSKAPSRAEAGLPEQGFVFASFNATYKFEPVLFAVWMEILRQAPGSLLWLPDRNAPVTGNLRTEAEKHGVDPQRLFFATPLPAKTDYLARLRLADLILDTRIYNGHSTTCDALLAGVPVLTLPGGHFAARVSASLLKAAGLPELIAADMGGYEQKAVQLAANPVELGTLKEKCRAAATGSPLFDTVQLVLDLEAAYLRMWEIKTGCRLLGCRL